MTQFRLSLALEYLLIGAVIAALGLLSIQQSPSLLRLPLSMIALLFIPGYLLLGALFPQQDTFDPPQRLALSFAVSLALIPAITLLLDYAKFGVHTESSLGILAVFSVVMGAASLLRRSQISADQRFQWAWSLPQLSRSEALLYAAVVLAALLIAGSALAISLLPSPTDHFTEFFMLGPDDKAVSYPTQITLGESVTVAIGLINQEQQPMEYRIALYNGDQLIYEEPGIALNAGERLEKDLTFTPVVAGESSPILLYLYRPGDTEPYRSLRLWLQVLE